MANAHDLLMAHRAAMMGGKLTAKDYVQDGLIAMWDGIENAGWGVHDPNATVWKDLAGNYDLDLTSNAIWVQDGIKGVNNNNCLAKFGATINGALHIECCWKERELSFGETCLIFTSGTKSGDRYREFLALYGPSAQYATRGYVCRTIVYRHESKNQTSSVSAEIDNRISLNGSTLPTYYGSYFTTRGNFAMIGGTDNQGFGCTTPIHNVRVYSRALSSDEIAANYAIDNARFGLT